LMLRAPRCDWHPFVAPDVLFCRSHHKIVRIFLRRPTQTVYLKRAAGTTGGPCSGSYAARAYQAREGISSAAAFAQNRAFHHTARATPVFWIKADDPDQCLRGTQIFSGILASYEAARRCHSSIRSTSRAALSPGMVWASR